MVPNGPHSGGGRSVADSRAIPAFRTPIEMAHANVARTHGLALASGGFVRFLDDDDYLLPAAARQVDVLRDTGADLCSGRIGSLDQDGTHHGAC